MLHKALDLRAGRGVEPRACVAGLEVCAEVEGCRGQACAVVCEEGGRLAQVGARRGGGRGAAVDKRQG